MDARKHEGGRGSSRKALDHILAFSLNPQVNERGMVEPGQLQQEPVGQGPAGRPPLLTL